MKRALLEFPVSVAGVAAAFAAFNWFGNVEPVLSGGEFVACIGIGAVMTVLTNTLRKSV